MIKKLDHINIVVSNIEKSINFFALLGFNVEDRAPLHGQWVSLIVGLENVDAEYVKLHLPHNNTRIELIHFTNPPSESDPRMNIANQLGYRHIAFEVNDIATVTTNLQQHGIKLLSPVQTYPKTGKQLVYFYGPDNILLELAQYH
jgi:catechol 2,3-dioxygenase-like lactoylglutathione lyase family enzyme